MPVAATKLAIVPQEAAGLLRSPGTRTLVVCLLLVAATLAAYNSVSRNDFVNYDDDRYVLGNPHVRAGLHWSTIKWAFSSLEQANWHPLTWLSHALDYQLFQLNPAGHHYTSLLLHVSNVLLLFLLLQWVTGSPGRSLMVAALFAVHPLNVESVAWLAERKNVLAMLFFLLALGAYGWYVRRPGTARYLMVAALFALGLMSKPMVITLPFVLLLLDYWPLGRMYLPGGQNSCDEAAGPADAWLGPQPVWRLCLEKIPLLALSVGSVVITMWAQRVAGAMLSSGAHSPLLRLENALICYVRYIGKTVWPSRLAVLYPYPRALPAWQALTSALFLLTVTWIVLKYRKHRYLPVGWFWYLGTMVPMIGLVQVGNQAMADRYAYLPLIGLFVMVVWGVAELARRYHVAGKYLAAAGAAAVVALAMVTHIQVEYWHDDIRLWAHALSVTGPNFVAENNLGTILAKQGRYEEAIPHFRAASALEPGDSVSQLNLGIYAQQHGDLQQAIARYKVALQLAVDTQIRAAAYANLGQIYYALGDYARARENYESAMKLHNPFPVPLGLIAQKSSDWKQAIAYYEQAVAAEPSDVGFLLLAQALRNGGRGADAQWAEQQAQRRSKNIHQARQTLDRLLAQ